MKQLITFVESEWYKGLLDELSASLTEVFATVQEELIKWNYLVGKNLRQAEKGHEVSLTHLLQSLAVDMNCSERKLWDTITVYDNILSDSKLNAILSDKSVSVTRLLKQFKHPELADLECEHKNTKVVKVCITCGKQIHG